MIQRGANLVRQIESVLREEMDLQVQYAALMEEEGKHITKFNSEKIVELSSRRAQLSQQIDATRMKRDALCEQFPEFEGKRLTDLIRKNCHPEDVKRLISLADKFKVLVNGNKKRGFEFGQITQFALNLVTGSLSIIWSATQSVTRSYGRNGVVSETYTPKTRGQSTLEEV